jgi:histidinol-phosphatase
MDTTRTDPTTLTDSLDLALKLADHADAVALASQAGNLEIDVKPDGTLVTAADRRIEAELREIIAVAQPEAGVLGEEQPEFLGVGRWVIDPIDGTEFYAEGDPRYAVLIAFEEAGEVTVGVVSAPALALRWWAAKGKGAWLSRHGAAAAARVTITQRLWNARGLFIGGGAFRTHGIPGVEEPAAVWDGLVARGLTPVRLTSSWEAVRVASGECDLAFTAGWWWDVAPMSVIVGEAGGHAAVMVDADGRVGMALSNDRLMPALSRYLPGASPGKVESWLG